MGKTMRLRSSAKRRRTSSASPSKRYDSSWSSSGTSGEEESESVLLESGKWKALRCPDCGQLNLNRAFLTTHSFIHTQPNASQPTNGDNCRSCRYPDPSVIGESFFQPPITPPPPGPSTPIVVRGWLDDSSSPDMFEKSADADARDEEGDGGDGKSNRERGTDIAMSTSVDSDDGVVHESPGRNSAGLLVGGSQLISPRSDADKGDNPTGDIRTQSEDTLLISLEKVADGIHSIRAAIEAGVQRIVLCSPSSSSQGVGLTPTMGLLMTARKHFPTIHFTVMIRYRGEDFVYSEEELEVMTTDILQLKEHGASGFAFAVLTSSNEVNHIACERLLESAHPLPCSFHHQAFHQLADKHTSLDSIRRIGFKRILLPGVEGVRITRLDQAENGQLLIHAQVGQTVAGPQSSKPGSAQNILSSISVDHLSLVGARAVEPSQMTSETCDPQQCRTARSDPMYPGFVRLAKIRGNFKVKCLEEGCRKEMFAAHFKRKRKDGTMDAEHHYIKHHPGKYEELKSAFDELRGTDRRRVIREDE